VKVLPWHTNPFDLSAHLEDEHEMSPLSLDLMDSEELRRTHLVIHRRSWANRGHMHEDQGVLLAFEAE
jgi:hypothetical protein